MPTRTSLRAASEVTGPHRRHDPLGGGWVLVSPQRTQRPWQGAEEAAPSTRRPTYDPDCYLCPGNARAGGHRNPAYETTFVFTNDFPALQPDRAAEERAPHPLLRTHTQPGTCRVLCFSPRHDVTLAGMGHPDVRRVIDLWADEVTELGARYRWVQVFENKGAEMGASNPHPHGQIWASEVVPDLPSTEDANQRRYLGDRGTRLLADYADLEADLGERVVVATDRWVAVVPYWARWPFETLLLPRRAVARLPDLDDADRDDLAVALTDLLGRYDRLFDRPFPYSMGWHGAPTDQDHADHWQLHAHFLPPLLRSATVRKFMVGYELLADVQRDLTAEQAAARLRERS